MDEKISESAICFFKIRYFLAKREKKLNSCPFYFVTFAK